MKCFICGNKMDLVKFGRTCDLLPSKFFECYECGFEDSGIDRDYKTRDWYIEENKKSVRKKVDTA